MQLSWRRTRRLLEIGLRVSQGLVTVALIISRVMAALLISGVMVALIIRVMVALILS